MKKLLLASIVICTSFIANAQSTITNAGMENWISLGGSNGQEPTQWNSNKSGSGWATSGPVTCFQEATNPHGGTYCAKVVTGTYFGTVVNGSLATGQIAAPTTNKADGYIHSKANDANYGMTFTARPDSIVFWYRYTKAGSDYPKVETRLHVGNAYTPETPSNGNHPDSTVNIIARAIWNGPASTVANWTRISVPFTYVAGAPGLRTPAYVLISSTSSGNQTGGSDGSTMWLDDFEAIYNPAITTSTINPTTYYVSAADSVSITVPFSYSGTFTGGNTFVAQLSNASGSFASPIILGSTAATSTNAYQQAGSITGKIPAGTATGTGYRVRVVATSPATTGTDNGANITINLVSNSIAPTAVQNILTNTAGTQLAVTESTGAQSKAWKYSTTSGSGYVPFAPAETGQNYTPNFSTPGTYYIICESTYPGGIVVKSNEVQVNVIGNSIAPAAPQSFIAGQNGTQLNVAEVPTGTSREWKFSTTPGGPYSSFTPFETDSFFTSFNIHFASPGTYYIVCVSTINSFTVTSNEVEITVTGTNLLTGTIANYPGVTPVTLFEFSPSAPNDTVNVPYSTLASVFVPGNVFTAQLSDANGVFSNPTLIGSKSDTTSGTIMAIIPKTTPAGNAYRIRVVSSNMALTGIKNTVDLTVDQFNNSISPSAPQSILFNTAGTQLSVTNSQTVQPASNEWKFSTVQGGPYSSFSPAITGPTFTPNFAAPGTYFVVCVSKNQYTDSVTSNEVEITVTNGNVITTQAVTGSPYYISPKANEQVTVTFTSNAYFYSGNSFVVELSDANGSFASPVILTPIVTGTTIAPITVQIPNNSLFGTAYRLRVSSSNPQITGSDNGSNLQIIPFTSSVAPVDTQELLPSQAGNTITATESHPSSTREWLFSNTSGSNYGSFAPAQTNVTYTPQFAAAGNYFVRCLSVNSADDSLYAQEVVVIVASDTTGIGETNLSTAQLYVQNGNLIIIRDLQQEEKFELYNMNGQLVLSAMLFEQISKVDVSGIASGVYVFAIGNRRGKISLLNR